MHKKPSQIQKKNEKQILAEAFILGTNKMPVQNRVIFLAGYIACDIGVLPNQANTTSIMTIINGLQEYASNQIITNTNLVQVFVQASECTRKVKGNIPNDQIMGKFQTNIQQLVNQVIDNRTYIRNKWTKQKKQETQSQIILKESPQKEQKKLQNKQQKPYKSKIQLQQQQSMKLIIQLQEQDQRYQQARILRYKEQQAKLRQLLNQQKKLLQQQKMKIKSSQNQISQCLICAEAISYTNIGLLSCKHIFHRSCIKKYIQTLVNEKKVDIPCPSGCGYVLTDNDVYEFIDGALKQKYDKFSFDLYIEKNDKQISWCPTAECTAVFGYEPGIDNYRCPICMKHYCLKCRCQFHIKKTCQQYRESMKDTDKQFQNFVIGLKFKQCPECKFWVERSMGCSSMTCRCGTKFCYDCGGRDCPHGNCKKKLAAIGRFI